MKKNEGKPIMHYVYTSMINEVARVREYGVQKHGSEDGWKTTTPIEHYDAAERHIRALMEGELKDPESGFLHAAHAICDLMFEIERLRISGAGENIKTILIKKEQEEEQEQEPIGQDMNRRGEI